MSLTERRRIERWSHAKVPVDEMARIKYPELRKSVIEAIQDLPHQARRSVTFYRGSEFMNGPHLQAEIGTQMWFCDPSSSWKIGTVKNTNRRTRPER